LGFFFKETFASDANHSGHSDLTFKLQLWFTVPMPLGQQELKSKTRNWDESALAG